MKIFNYQHKIHFLNIFKPSWSKYVGNDSIHLTNEGHKKLFEVINKIYLQYLKDNK